MPCSDGAGIKRFAPPLAGSEWVTGDEKRLTLIILHGLEGPITVRGKTYDAPDILPVMPSHATMDDKAMMAIMNYIRNEWGNRADPISQNLVGKTRHTTQGKIQRDAGLNRHHEISLRARFFGRHICSDGRSHTAFPTPVCQRKTHGHRCSFLCKSMELKPSKPALPGIPECNRLADPLSFYWGIWSSGRRQRMDAGFCKEGTRDTGKTRAVCGGQLECHFSCRFSGFEKEVISSKEAGAVVLRTVCRRSDDMRFIILPPTLKKRVKMLLIIKLAAPVLQKTQGETGGRKHKTGEHGLG